MLSKVRNPDCPIKQGHVAVGMVRDWMHDSNVSCLVHIVTIGNLDKANGQEAASVVFSGNVALELYPARLDGDSRVVRTEPKAWLVGRRIGT